LDGRIAAAVEDLAADDVDDGGHGFVLVSRKPVSLCIVAGRSSLYHWSPKAGKRARLRYEQDTGNPAGRSRHPAPGATRPRPRNVARLLPVPRGLPLRPG